MNGRIAGSMGAFPSFPTDTSSHMRIAAVGDVFLGRNILLLIELL